MRVYMCVCLCEYIPSKYSGDVGGGIDLHAAYAVDIDYKTLKLSRSFDIYCFV